MRNLLLLITTLTAMIPCAAQNYVPNWSFEQHSQCPDDYGQVDRCVNWHRSWNNNNPLYHTEYLHACGSSMFGEPSNTWGYQAASTGQGYMAEVTMAPSVMTDYRENIYAPLIAPLEVGHQYSATVKISFTDNSQHASNNFGLKMSTVSSFPIDGICQVHSNNIVTDATTWTTISGVFTADSAYTYVCVGNFIPDANTLTSTPCPSCSFVLYGYYVDDVCVTSWTPETGSGDCLTLFSPVGINTIAQRNPGMTITSDGGMMQVITASPLPTDGTLSVIDAAGRVVRSMQARAGSDHISLFVGDLDAAIYMIDLRTSNWNSARRIAITR